MATASTGGKTPAYRKLESLADKHLGRTEWSGYRVCEGTPPGEEVVMYDAGGKDIAILDTKRHSVEKYTFRGEIYRMCYLAKHKYIICDITNDPCELHIVTLTSKGTEKKSTMDQPTGGWEVWAVCEKEENTFILIDEKVKENKTRISEVVVSGKNSFKSRVICELDFCNFGASICMYSDKEHVVLTSGEKSLCKVHINTGRSTQVDLSGKLIDVMCLAVDSAGNILVGDRNCEVHLVTGDLRYGGQIDELKCDRIIRGLAVRGEKVYVIVQNHVYVYK